MKISEAIEILEDYRIRYGDLELYKILGCSYRPLDTIEFIGGQRCVFISKEHDKRNHEIIKEMNEIYNRYKKAAWLKDCEG